VILTTQQVAEMLCCTPETVEVRARRKELPGLKAGRAWVFPQEALLIALNALALKNISTSDPQVTRRGRKRILRPLVSLVPTP
jgi:excisionase family DNA binding protein